MTTPSTDHSDATRSRIYPWLSEPRRSIVSVVIAAVVVVVISFSVAASGLQPISSIDAMVLALLMYLTAYLIITTVAFTLAPAALIRHWASRDARGTALQRYVLGTAPGPGTSILVGAVALVVAVVWLPGRFGGNFPQSARIAVAVALVAVAWLCVVVSFAITYHADNLVEHEQSLRFPGDATAQWADYVYFAVSVMTTFGTTDVTVTSRAMRRTVTVNAVIAFVFNTVIVATLVTTLTGL